MEKSTDFVVLTTESGRRFAIPCHIIAHDRACYYAKLEGRDIYEAEYKQTIKDELLDWAKNSMNWEHVAEFAIELPRLNRLECMEEQWSNSDLSDPVTASELANLTEFPQTVFDVLDKVYKTHRKE